jgi:hypothetical protein
MYMQEAPGVGVDASDEDVLHCAYPVVEQTSASGHYRAAGVLRPTSTATSVRMREGHRLVTDGPFAETREQLAGYLLINAKNLDEAIVIAGDHPAAQTGTVEIRPVLVLPSAQ